MIRNLLLWAAIAFAAYDVLAEPHAAAGAATTALDGLKATAPAKARPVSEGRIRPGRTHPAAETPHQLVEPRVHQVAPDDVVVLVFRAAVRADRQREGP